MVDIKPYATVRPFLGTLPSWLREEDAVRLSAYSTYEGIYKNLPDAFKLVRRGEDDNPIFLPSARTIVETINRYLCKDWTYTIQPIPGGTANDAQVAEMELLLGSLWKREQIAAKFATQKRWCLVRGDAVWHVRADSSKDAGTRISIDEVDPASYFPIYDEWNPEKVVGCHLVDPVVNDAGKTVIKRQTYRKQDQRITYELSWWETGAWDDRDDTITLKSVPSSDIPEGEWNKPVSEQALDARIQALPVYHVKNQRETNSTFGSSELAGFETLIAAINQSITDEELTLALQGLGLYWTNSGPPVDENNKETNWKLGPGYVVEVDAESTFGRTQGVSSVEPTQTHISKLESSMREAAGTPDIAVGSVDVQTAESGIALQFKMAPILAAVGEKQLEILSVMDHLLFDLTTMWFPAFEGFSAESLRVSSQIADPMPVNRDAVLQEILALLSTSPPLISADYARQLLSQKLGYVFPDTMANDIVAETSALTEARNPDSFDARVQRELLG